MKEFKLKKSGRVLKVTPASFAEAKELYKAVASELRLVTVTNSREADLNFIKECFLTLIASDRVEAQVFNCMKRCVYNDAKLSPEVFDEDEVSREDFLPICRHILEVNIGPFMKGLYAELSEVMGVVNALDQG